LSVDVNQEKLGWSRRYGVIVFHLLILVALAVVIYYPVLAKPLNNFDDLKWLADTELRNTFTTIFDPSLVTKNPFASTYYLPLQSALYFGLVKVFGRSPMAFHAFSIGIHALASVLIYFLLLTFSKRKTLAFLGGFTFVAYLGHKQSITWTAAAFSHPLVSVFVLATLLFFYAFLKTNKKVTYFSALAMFIVGLLIRESAVVLPPLLIVLELFGLGQVGEREKLSFSISKRDLIQRSYKYIPFFLAIIPIALISIRKFQHGSLNERWGGVVSGIYPGLRFLDFSSLLVYPAKLGVSMKLILVALLLAIASWIIFNFRKQPLLFFALFWIAVALAPYTISNFNPALAVTRYLYPAMIPFCLLLTLVFSKLVEKGKKGEILSYLMFAAIGGAHLFYVLKAMY